MGVIVEISQFLLGLSILILLHEAGHYTAARIFKIRVEKFYLFFDPWFSLFKFKKGDTEYGIGWLPLGGYVKISGMIDESMDKEQMKKPAEPWEFRAKPTWQRLVVMVAGITVNLILGVLIYCFFLNSYGSAYMPVKNATNGIYCDALATSLGFKPSDVIVGINHKTVLSMDSVGMDILLDSPKSIQVERNGKIVDINIPKDSASAILNDMKSFLVPLQRFCVDSVGANTGAAYAGLKKGDSIVCVDTFKTPYYQSFAAAVQKYAGKYTFLGVKSNGHVTYPVVHISDQGTVGFFAKADTFKLVRKSYTVVQSIPGGFNMAVGKVKSIAKQLRLMVTVKDAHKQMGSFISFAKAYGTVWDWEHFWLLTAFISIMLAFFNILPIPALDGGHVMFLLYEMITGRKPNEKVMEYAQWAGMILLLSVIVYANGLDIGRLFHK